MLYKYCSFLVSKYINELNLIVTYCTMTQSDLFVRFCVNVQRRNLFFHPFTCLNLISCCFPHRRGAVMQGCCGSPLKIYFRERGQSMESRRIFNMSQLATETSQFTGFYMILLADMVLKLTLIDHIFPVFICTIQPHCVI